MEVGGDSWQRYGLISRTYDIGHLIGPAESKLKEFVKQATLTPRLAGASRSKGFDQIRFTPRVAPGYSQEARKDIWLAVPNIGRA